MVSKERAKKDKAKAARIKADEAKSEEQIILERELNRLSKQKCRAQQSDQTKELLSEQVNYQNNFCV